jgi:hypothetical protein
MTNYNKVFEEKQYRAITARAAKYYQETAKSAAIPMIKTDVPDAKEYTYVTLQDPIVTQGGLEWSEQGKLGVVSHDSATIKLFSQMMHLNIHNNDIANFGSQLIADKKDAKIQKFALDVDDAVFHGPKTTDNPNTPGIQLAEGLIGQLTSIQNVAGAAASLATKGYGWAAIKYIMDDIPFAMREEGPDMLLYMDELFYSKMTAPDRVYNDKVEWDFIYDTFMGPKAIHGRKIANVIVTNKILTEATDDTDGDGADSADTVGTHSRLLLMVPDPRWVGRVVSRGFSLVGEEQGMLHVHQLYGHRSRAYFFNTDCANFTEQLTW